MAAEMAAALESESETRHVPLSVPKTVPARMMKRIALISGRMVIRCSDAAYAGYAHNPSPFIKPATASTRSAIPLAPVSRLRR